MIRNTDDKTSLQIMTLLKVNYVVRLTFRTKVFSLSGISRSEVSLTSCISIQNNPARGFKDWKKKVNPMKIFLITAFKKSFLHTISSDKYCFSWHVFYSKQIQVKMESHVLWQETVFIKFKPQCALLYVFVFLKSVLCIRMYKDVHLCAAAICAQVYVCFVHAPLHQTYL